MPRDRVVIVGAGVAGLVSAFALAARGLDVTVLERSTLPGGKIRQVGRSLIDSGPTEEALDEYIAGYTTLAQQPVHLH